MTGQALRPPLPPHLQPATKTSSTAKSSHLSATAHSSPAPSRASSQSRLSKPWLSARHEDHTSDKATTALIRRVLCTNPTSSDPKGQQRPIEEFLPPLTSSNDVDLQLYAVIAIIIKDFVGSWYSKITTDHGFVEEVVQIIAHCTRALEERLRHIDLQELLLDEIPALCASHIQAYRSAHEECQSLGYLSDPRSIYHALNPHPALTPTPISINATKTEEQEREQAQNEALYRQLLVEGVLAVLLPTEDLNNTCLRTLVGDVIADLILGQGVSSKLCEGWFVYQTISKVAEIARARIEPKADGKEIEDTTRSRLEKFGLLSSADGTKSADLPRVHQSRLSSLFWRLLQYSYLGMVFVRFIVVGLLQARTAPPRFYPSILKSAPSSPSSTKAFESRTPKRPWSPALPALRRPVTEYRSSTFLATLLDLSTRMPWLVGFCSLLQHMMMSGTGRIGEADGLLDRFLSQTISSHVLTPQLIPQAILALRTSLFPHNTLGPPAPPPPSAAETLALRRAAASSCVALVPEVAVKVYFGVEGEGWVEDAVTQVEELLEVFGDGYCNRHLVFGVVDLVVGRVVPEMREKGPGELLGERIG